MSTKAKKKNSIQFYNFLFWRKCLNSVHCPRWNITFSFLIVEMTNDCSPKKSNNCSPQARNENYREIRQCTEVAAQRKKVGKIVKSTLSEPSSQIGLFLSDQFQMAKLTKNSWNCGWWSSMTPWKTLPLLPSKNWAKIHQPYKFVVLSSNLWLKSESNLSPVSAQWLWSSF